MKTVTRESVAPLEIHNKFLVVLFVGLSLYQLFFIPLFMLNKNISLALSLLPLIFMNNTFWSLIHEGIHSKLSENIKTNDFLSRLLSIGFGSPFRALQLAHLLHHKYNRTPLERNEIYDPSTLSAARAKIAFYFRLFFGVYIQELFIPFITLLPRKTIKNILDKKFPVDSYNRIAVETFLKKERNLSETRFDLLCIFTLFFLSFYCYGHYWPLLVLLLIVRAVFISFLDYSYHYGTKTDDVSFSLNLALPKFLSKSILHFNYHGTHHRHPLTPWHALPRVFESENKVFEDNFFRGAVRQLKGPVPIVLAAASPSNENTFERIKSLIKKKYDGNDVSAEELQEALQVKGIFLFSKEKQLCIVAELCNYLHTDADFEMALSYVGKKSLILMFALHSFRRQKVVNDLFDCVKSRKEFPDRVKDAFGIQSKFHGQILRSSIIMQKLSRRNAIFCCYNEIG